MQRQAYLLLVLTTLFWGGNAVAGKLAVGHVSPMLLTVLRWTIACAILYAIGRHRLRADWPVVRAHLPLFFAFGFVGFTVYNVALYSALLHTTAVNASIEHAGIGLFVFALNYLFFRQRVAAGQVLGFALAFAGVAVTASHGDLAALMALEVNRGDALVLAAIVAYAGYTVALRRRPAIHWQSFMIVLTGAAALTSLPFVAAERLAGAMIWPDLLGWGVVLFAALLPSILSQVFYVRSVEAIGANRAGLFVNLVPIFGALLSVLVLGEEFHPYHALAVILTLGGIWLAEWSARRMAVTSRR